MANSDPRFFCEISRIDEDKRIIECYGTRGDVKDTFGTIIDLTSAAACMADYMDFPALRSMHNPVAAGSTISYEVDDKGVLITAKVVDDAEWNKVKEGVYRGLSVGGKQDYTVRAGKNIGRIKSENWKEDDVIHLKSITEFSLVDSPSNRGCGDLVYRISNKEETIMKFSEETDITRYAGEEIGDTQSACYALTQIQYLLNKEKGESDEPTGPEQIAALTAAIAALKTFITSEIQEDTSAEPVVTSYWAAVADLCRAEDTREDSVTRMAEIGFVPVEVERKGAAISKDNLTRIQTIHDHASDMGAVCRCGDVTKADGTDDDIHRLATLESDLTRINGELDTLRADVATKDERIKALESEPVPAKAALLAVNRGDDIGTEDDKVKRVEDTDEYKNGTDIQRAQLKMKESLTKPQAFYR